MAQWLHFVASLAQWLIPSSKKSHQGSLQNILFLIYSLNLFEGHFYQLKTIMIFSSLNIRGHFRLSDLFSKLVTLESRFNSCIAFRQISARRLFSLIYSRMSDAEWPPYRKTILPLKFEGETFGAIKNWSEVWPEVSRKWSLLIILVIVWESWESVQAFGFIILSTTSEFEVPAKWQRTS